MALIFELDKIIHFSIAFTNFEEINNEIEKVIRSKNKNIIGLFNAFYGFLLESSNGRI